MKSPASGPTWYVCKSRETGALIVQLHLVDFGENHGSAKTLCDQRITTAFVPEGRVRDWVRCVRCGAAGSLHEPNHEDT